MSDRSWYDDPPTERQLEYAKSLDVALPPGATKGEVSDLIQAALDDDEPASDEWRRAAESYGIRITRFTGKTRIREAIFNTLCEPGREPELVAWFARWVYVDLLGSDGKNIDVVAAQVRALADDPRVVSSIRRYSAVSVTRFGDGYDGRGSRRTIAYKEVSAALKAELGLETKTRRPRADVIAAADSRSGCLSLAVLAFLLVVWTLLLV